MGKYKPFPNGTVRGPYRSNNVVTYMVQTAGGWVPFTGTPAVTKEAETEKRAKEFAKQHA